PARRRTGRRRPPHAAPPPPPSPPPGLARRRRPAVGPRPRRLLRPPVARLPGTLRLPQGLRRRGLGPPLGSPHRPEGRLLRPPPGHPPLRFHPHLPRCPGALHRGRRGPDPAGGPPSRLGLRRLHRRRPPDARRPLGQLPRDGALHPGGLSLLRGRRR